MSDAGVFEKGSLDRAVDIDDDQDGDGDGVGGGGDYNVDTDASVEVDDTFVMLITSELQQLWHGLWFGYLDGFQF